MFCCMRVLRYYGPFRHPDTCLSPFPLSGYRDGLLSDISSPGVEGFSSFHSVFFLHVAADTPPVRTCRFRLFRQALFAFARYRPSQPPELKCYEATPTFIAHYNLECCPCSWRTRCQRAPPFRFRSYGASQATGGQSFSPGRTFTY